VYLLTPPAAIEIHSYDISFEDAGHYLSTFKQFEHKPPDLIKERVDKDYNSILRSSLTSISKVNKTDVETLRTSFGVRCCLYFVCETVIIDHFQSFSNIAKATSDQLQNLPGFGQIKVKNIKNAFEKPIRNNSTNSLSFTVSQLQNPSPNDQVVAKTQAKGKERPESTLKMSSSSQLPERPPRRPSPVWDIELDSPPSMPTAENGPDPESTSEGPSSPIPTWDIELDLNASEEEDNAQASA
jgi:DNA excision repair protein ERCC-1